MGAGFLPAAYETEAWERNIRFCRMLSRFRDGRSPVFYSGAGHATDSLPRNRSVMRLNMLAFIFRHRLARFALMAPALIVPNLFATTPAEAQQRIENPVAVFSGLDKITGRLTDFDVFIDETVQFGALQVTPRVCKTSAEGEVTQTDAFVEVDEITLDREIRRIFSGWMFAASPGLNAVEHPVYDVWLKSCKTDSDVPAPSE